MRLPQFSFYQPTTVDEAVEVLKEKAGARLLSGGTDLLVNMKHRVELPHALVSLRRIAGLRGITRDGGATVIGALTTLKEVQNSTELQAEYPALVEAARSVGSYRHQTMGSLGGNVCQNTRCRFFNQTWNWRQARSLCYKAGGEDCHVMNKEGVCYSTYCGDTAPALLVLDAQVRVQGAGGIRQFPLAELYSGEGRTPLALEPSDVVTALVIPESSQGHSCYVRHSLRGAIDFPIVGAAVWKVDDALRVAFTGVDRAPVRASALEEKLQGRDLDEQAVREVAPLARKAATVTRTTTQSATYKRELMATLFQRAVGGLQ